MNSQSSRKVILARRFFRANIILGGIVIAYALYSMITGQYENLQAREAADALLGKLAIGGVLYAALSWYACVFSRPFLARSGPIR